MCVVGAGLTCRCRAADFSGTPWRARSRSWTGPAVSEIPQPCTPAFTSVFLFPSCFLWLSVLIYLSLCLHFLICLSPCLSLSLSRCLSPPVSPFLLGVPVSLSLCFSAPCSRPSAFPLPCHCETQPLVASPLSPTLTPSSHCPSPLPWVPPGAGRGSRGL